MCLQTVKQLIMAYLLGADGEVWFDNLKLEVVDKNVSVTSAKQK